MKRQPSFAERLAARDGAATMQERIRAKADKARAAYDSHPQPGMAPSPPPASPGPGGVSSRDGPDLDAMVQAVRTAMGELTGSMDALSENLLRKDRVTAIDIEVVSRDADQNIKAFRVKKARADLH